MELATTDVDFDSCKQCDSDDMYLLNQLIHTIAENVKFGNKGVFDISKPCAVCGATGHSFDQCPLLLDKGAVTKSYIRIVTTLRRLLNSINQNRPAARLNQLASQGFQSAMNAISTSTAHPHGIDPQLVHSMATSIVDLNNKYGTIVSALSSRNAARTNDDDSDSVSTTGTDRTDASINAINSYLRKSDLSDFR